MKAIAVDKTDKGLSLPEQIDGNGSGPNAEEPHSLGKAKGTSDIKDTSDTNETTKTAESSSLAVSPNELLNPLNIAFSELEYMCSDDSVLTYDEHPYLAAGLALVERNHASDTAALELEGRIHAESQLNSETNPIIARVHALLNNYGMTDEVAAHLRKSGESKKKAIFSEECEYTKDSFSGDKGSQNAKNSTTGAMVSASKKRNEKNSKVRDQKIHTCSVLAQY